MIRKQSASRGKFLGTTITAGAVVVALGVSGCLSNTGTGLKRSRASLLSRQTADSMDIHGMVISLDQDSTIKIDATNPGANFQIKFKFVYRGENGRGNNILSGAMEFFINGVQLNNCSKTFPAILPDASNMISSVLNCSIANNAPLAEGLNRQEGTLRFTIAGSSDNRFPTIYPLTVEITKKKKSGELSFGTIGRVEANQLAFNVPISFKNTGEAALQFVGVDSTTGSEAVCDSGYLENVAVGATATSTITCFNKLANNGQNRPSDTPLKIELKASNNNVALDTKSATAIVAPSAPGSVSNFLSLGMVTSSMSDISSRGVIDGGAYDPDQPQFPNHVFVYVDSRRQGGALTADLLANLASPGTFNAEFSTTGNHGFRYELGAKRDGNVHHIEIWSIDLTPGKNPTMIFSQDLLIQSGSTTTTPPTTTPPVTTPPTTFPTTPSGACDRSRFPAGEFEEKNGRCLPSCGRLGGTALLRSGTSCASQGLVAAGRDGDENSAYEVGACCKVRDSVPTNGDVTAKCTVKWDDINSDRTVTVEWSQDYTITAPQDGLVAACKAKADSEIGNSHCAQVAGGAPTIHPDFLPLIIQVNGESTTQFNHNCR